MLLFGVVVLLGVCQGGGVYDGVLVNLLVGLFINIVFLIVVIEFNLFDVIVYSMCGIVYGQVGKLDKVVEDFNCVL